MEHGVFSHGLSLAQGVDRGKIVYGLMRFKAISACFFSKQTGNMHCTFFGDVIYKNSITSKQLLNIFFLYCGQFNISQHHKGTKNTKNFFVFTKKTLCTLCLCGEKAIEVPHDQ